MFDVTESGSRIHWPEGDVDINMETIRERTDLEKTKRRTDKMPVDTANRSVYCGKGIGQRDIPDLSDGQVRRVEKGRTVPHIETLKKLAAAHEIYIDEYLKALAILSRAGVSRRKAA